MIFKSSDGARLTRGHSARPAAAELVWLLLPPLSILYGRSGPALAALAAAQVVGWRQLIRARAQGKAPSSPRRRQTLPKEPALPTPLSMFPMGIDNDT